MVDEIERGDRPELVAQWADQNRVTRPVLDAFLQDTPQNQHDVHRAAALTHLAAAGQSSGIRVEDWDDQAERHYTYPREWDDLKRG